MKRGYEWIRETSGLRKYAKEFAPGEKRPRKGGRKVKLPKKKNPA